MTASSQRVANILNRLTKALGSPAAVIAALALLVSWACTGPLLAFSETWQLIINTTTTIITFLMVFIIQETQNRNERAVHLKLDAILQALGIDEDDLINLEDRPAADIEAKEQEVKG